MRSVVSFLAVAFVAVAPVAHAQVAQDSSHLARGIVGFEAGIGQTPGLLAFFFSSPTTSWLVGIDRVTTEAPVGTRAVRSTSPGFRVGVRKWPQEMTGPFKLFVGAGLATADVDPAQSGTGDEFGYGELGTTFFLGWHLSLNATGELSVAYGKDQSGNATPTTPEVLRSRLFVRGTRFRVGAAVYLF